MWTSRLTRTFPSRLISVTLRANRSSSRSIPKEKTATWHSSKPICGFKRGWPEDQSMRSSGNPAAFRIGSAGALLEDAASFVDGYELIRDHVGELLGRSARPGDFDRVHNRILPQTEYKG